MLGGWDILEEGVSPGEPRCVRTWSENRCKILSKVLRRLEEEKLKTALLEPCAAKCVSSTLRRVTSSGGAAGLSIPVYITAPCGISPFAPISPVFELHATN